MTAHGVPGLNYRRFEIACRSKSNLVIDVQGEIDVIVCRLDRLPVCLWIAFVCTVGFVVTNADAGLELKDGDRVVLLGGTFIEREGQFGYLETALTTAWPDRHVTFRNLGWSGDTVWAESRGIFDPAQVGYQRMLDLVKELKPTLIILAYGQNESFAGEAGLGKFIAQYEKLCDDLAATGARLAFMTPPKFERPRPPLPDVSRHNPTLAKYVAAVSELAVRRKSPLIDVFHVPSPTSSNLTENGLHFGETGYAALATALQKQEQWKPVATSQATAIRQKVVEKNMQFFHRWRPQNITYLTGFRKHEQGNNAVEIAQFDPLVEQLETEITQLLKK